MLRERPETQQGAAHEPPGHLRLRRDRLHRRPKSPPRPGGGGDAQDAEQENDWSEEKTDGTAYLRQSEPGGLGCTFEYTLEFRVGEDGLWFRSNTYVMRRGKQCDEGYVIEHDPSGTKVRYRAFHHEPRRMTPWETWRVTDKGKWLPTGDRAGEEPVDPEVDTSELDAAADAWVAVENATDETDEDE